MKSNSVAPALGKPTSISLTPTLHQQVEEALLLLAVHRIDQRLVAVAHVGGEPARRFGDRLRRPLPVGQVDLREGTVFYARIAQHGASPLIGSRAP
jgi:hypothetical protein